MEREKTELEELIESRITNLKITAEVFKNEYNDEENTKVYDAKIKLLESILEEYRGESDYKTVN